MPRTKAHYEYGEFRSNQYGGRERERGGKRGRRPDECAAVVTPRQGALEKANSGIISVSRCIPSTEY
jgi:hypothetical protein